MQSETVIAEATDAFACTVYVCEPAVGVCELAWTNVVSDVALVMKGIVKFLWVPMPVEPS